METKIRLTVTWRKHRNTHFGPQNGPVDVIEQSVPRFHVRAIQKGPHFHPSQTVIEQPRDVPLRVDATVVYEHIACRTSHFAAQRGWQTLHGFNRLPWYMQRKYFVFVCLNERM